MAVSSWSRVSLNRVTASEAARHTLKVPAGEGSALPVERRPTTGSLARPLPPASCPRSPAVPGAPHPQVVLVSRSQFVSLIAAALMLAAVVGVLAVSWVVGGSPVHLQRPFAGTASGIVKLDPLRHAPAPGNPSAVAAPLVRLQPRSAPATNGAAHNRSSSKPAPVQPKPPAPPSGPTATPAPIPSPTPSIPVSQPSATPRPTRPSTPTPPSRPTPPTTPTPRAPSAPTPPSPPSIVAPTPPVVNAPVIVAPVAPVAVNNVVVSVQTPTAPTVPTAPVAPTAPAPPIAPHNASVLPPCEPPVGEPPFESQQQELRP
jgi:hypothetical protein